MDEPREPGRPVVTVSYAQTLDGRLATSTGSSQWISGPESLQFAHMIRVRHDAVMVGAGTVCRDNPRLTVRLVEGRDPLRVVVDSSLRIPLQAAVLADGAARGTVLAVTARAPEERCRQAEEMGATVLRLPTTGDGRVDLPSLLAALYERGVRSVMVEGGAALITAMLRRRLAGRLAVTLAPRILGKGIEAVGDLGITDLARALTLQDVRLTPYGADLAIEATIVYPGPGGE